MKYCDKCKVNVIGQHERCPLCQRSLRIQEKDELMSEHNTLEDVYPYIPTMYAAHSLIFKIMAFASVAAIVISVALNLLISTKHWWSLFVIAGVGCFWLSFYVAFAKRKNIPKNMLYQVVMLSFIFVLWDYMTGWRGWSVDFAIPIVCLADLLVLYILSKIMHSDVEDYMIYMLIGGIFGIIPVIFYLFGWLHVLFPSLLCVTFSVLFFAAVVIFQGEKIKEELHRRLHY